MAASGTVLITGAAGLLGTLLRPHLEDRGYKLRLLDIEPDEEKGILAADFAEYDAAWAGQFAGVDTVVHLAGDPSPWSGWQSITRNNIDGALNALRAAGENGIKRFVFTSSNWVLGDHRFDDVPLTPETPPLPDTPYAQAKLFIERAAKCFGETYGMSVVCLRLGACRQGPAGEHPFESLGWGTWLQHAWLSPGDWCRGAECAITAAGVDYAIVNLVSRVEGTRWDLDSARASIGYEPADSIGMRLAPDQRRREALSRLWHRWGKPRFDRFETWIDRFTQAPRASKP